MNRILPLATAILLLNSCKFYQVYHSAPSTAGITQQEDHYVYDNGVIRIVYDFWGRQGTMHYTVYNTSKKPIYIDWKRSSFVKDKEKRNYYEERAVSSSTTVGGSTYSLGGSTRVAFTKGTAVKEERVSFLPPGSFIEKSFYRLITGGMIVPRSILRDTGIGNKKAKVGELAKGPGNLIFRNFITYSTTEDFKEEQFVDNEFYIDRVFIAKVNATLRDKEGHFYYPTQGPQSFYLTNLPKQNVMK